MKDYFTANRGCKIFFYGLVALAVCLLLLLITHLTFFLYLIYFAFLAIGVGSLWDTMHKRYIFLQNVHQLQYEHLKKIYAQQEAGEAVEMTSAFTLEEKRYIRHKKQSFIWLIIFKVFLLIAIFSLLLHF